MAWWVGLESLAFYLEGNELCNWERELKAEQVAFR
jgi:hypothetical protein